MSRTVRSARRRSVPVEYVVLAALLASLLMSSFILPDAFAHTMVAGAQGMDVAASAPVDVSTQPTQGRSLHRHGSNDDHGTTGRRR